MPTIGNLGTLYVRNKQGELEEVPVICGKDGEPGTPPHIGENGNWWIGEEDTGVLAVYDEFVDKANTAYKKSIKKISNSVGNSSTTGYKYSTTITLQDGTAYTNTFPVPYAISINKTTPSGNGFGEGNTVFWLDTSTSTLYVYCGMVAQTPAGYRHVWEPVYGHKHITTGEGAPKTASSSDTVVREDIKKDDLYIDTQTGHVYLCTSVAIANGDYAYADYKYTWKLVGGTGSSSGEGGTSFIPGDGLKLEDGVLSVDAHEITNEELQTIIDSLK